MAHLPARRGLSDPTHLMDDFTAYMNRVMGPYFSPLESEEGAWSPTADVSENDEAYHVDIDLPGVEKENITIDLEGQELSVTGEARKLEHMEGATARRTARSIGKFEFAVRLPHPVDAASCTAEFTDGVLCMTLPKTASGDHKTIEIT